MSEEHRKSEMTYPSGGTTLKIILIAALLFRWIHLAIVSGSDLVHLPIIDSAFYHNWAASISSGNALGGSIFFMSPLYPYFMGIFYTIFGVKPIWIMILQSIMSTGTVWMLYRFSASISGKKVGLISAGIAAVYAPFIFFDSTLLTSSLILFFSAIILNLTLTTFKKSNPVSLLLLGLVLGLSALTRPLVLIFIPFLLIGYFLANRKTFIRNTLHVIIGLLIVLTPVSIRNLVVGGEFVLTTSSAGMNFYVGNNAEATGLYWEAPFLSSVEPQYENEDYRRTASQKMEKNLTTRQAGNYWMIQALDWIINNPIDYIKLLFTKLFYFWNRAEFANNVSIHLGNWESPLLKFNPIGFWLIGPLGFSGLILMGIRLGWRKVRVAHFWVLAYMTGCMLFFVSSEYRLPIVLPLILGAAYLIVEIVNHFKGKQTEEAFKIIALGLLFFPLVNFRTPFIAGGDNARMDWFNLGNTLVKQYRYTEAIPRFQNSLAIDPYFAEALHKLAEAYYRSGDIDNALAIGKRVGLTDEEGILKIIRGESIHEAYALLQEGKFYAAFQEFLFAGWDTTSAIAETTRVGKIRDAQIAYSNGEFESALNKFRQVYASDSAGSPLIGYNIALLHWKFGYPDSTEFYVNQVLSLDSLNAPAIQLMARVYNATERQDKAIQILRRISPEAELQDRLLPMIRIEMDSLAALGMYNEALEAYGRYGRQYFPEMMPEDKVRLGRLQLEVGNTDLALRLLEEAESAGIETYLLLLHQGRALSKLNRLSEAKSVLQKAIVKEPEQPEARIVLAELYFSENKPGLAWKETEAINHLDIVSPEWSKRYQELRSLLQKIER